MSVRVGHNSSGEGCAGLGEGTGSSPAAESGEIMRNCKKLYCLIGCDAKWSFKEHGRNASVSPEGVTETETKKEQKRFS